MRFRAFVALLLTFAPIGHATEDWIDRLNPYLGISALHGNVRARLSGLLDLEGYYIEQPPPGLIFTDNRGLLNPRLTLFLDAQLGAQVYAFVQARADRGFDPSESDAEVRLDEWAVRWTPWKDGRFSAQIGRFGSIVGNWIPRHDSWDNPFVTAPLPYENLTGIWDRWAADSTETLVYWGHVPTVEYSDFGDGYSDKWLRSPIIWGPSYATGAAIFGRIGKVEYAAEIKNASLSSRPESWNIGEVDFQNPTFSTRFGFRPNPTWNFGMSASAGAYHLPEAVPSLATGKDLSDYRQIVLGQDISFEWHQLQVWAEFYEARFEVPFVGDADTFAYYVEAKYKFSTQSFGALRWNQQLYGTLRDEYGGNQRWGNDLWRLDAALGRRFTAHTQLKLQYSLEHDAADPSEFSHNFAGQFTVRF
jgi:hypothetical protein